MDYNFDSLKGTSINDVNPNDLIDINDVVIDDSLPVTERMKGFIKQIKNPYCYKCGDIVVKIKFAETDVTMEERMESYLRCL